MIKLTWLLCFFKFLLGALFSKSPVAFRAYTPSKAMNSQSLGLKHNLVEMNINYMNEHQDALDSELFIKASRSIATLTIVV